MDVMTIPERMLLGAVHSTLAQPDKRWMCTNGEEIQIIAAGMHNVHEGPDYSDMAVLFEGDIYVGAGEFHKKTSLWVQHNHSSNPQYVPVLLHIVLEHDIDLEVARWTLILSKSELSKGMLRRAKDKRTSKTSLPLEEIQHFALLRLLRQTANAQLTLSRLGPKSATTALFAEWMNRVLKKHRRPVSSFQTQRMKANISQSAVGLLVERLPEIEASDLLGVINRIEKERIGTEGAAFRREVFVNVILPLCCARATDSQRIVLLQWYWGASAAHAYGALRRKYPTMPQDFVWQQQGCLEYLRHHGQRTSTCAEVIRSYGIDRTVQFLRST